MVDESSGIKVFPSSEGEFVNEISTAIEQLVTKYELRKKMSESARFRAETTFNWQEKRERMSSLYLEMSKSEI